MRFSILCLSLASVAQVTFAAFDIYRVDATYHGGNHDYGYQIFETDKRPTCDDVTSTAWYGAKNDVSGNKLGVACDGEGCKDNNEPLDITRMEMHFSNNPKFHWTIYKDGDYHLIALDGAKFERCEPLRGHQYECSLDGGHKKDVGYRKFRCHTGVTATEIHNAK